MEVQEKPVYILNERLKEDLGKREIAFEFKGDDTDKGIFVFKMPNMGQIRVLMNTDDESMKVKEKTNLTIDIFKELVKIPQSSEVFESIWNAFFPDEIQMFTNRFTAALEDKRKK
ncbi:MAG: hypothetical protein V3V19_11285 [Cocleimonas sp.]